MMSGYTTVLLSGISVCRFSRKAAHDQMRSNETTFQSLSHHVTAKLLVNIFILTINQAAMCCVKGVSRSDEHTEKMTNSTVSLSSTERFSLFQLLFLVLWDIYCLVQSQRSHQPSFQQQQAAVFLFESNKLW